MKLATLGLATALAFTSSFAFAQSSGGAASGSSATGGAATSGTTTGSPATGTTSGNAMGTNPSTGMSNSAGSAAAGREQRAEPVGEHADQSLAQRFDSDAGTWRPIIARRQQKAPLRRGFFIRFVAGCYFFSSSNFLYFATSRVTSCPSTSGASSLASGATVERS